MADIENPHHKKNKPYIHDYPLWQLENIAQEVLKEAEYCIKGYRVDIEKLIETKYGILIDIHYGLQGIGVMAYMLTEGNRLFVDDRLIDDPRLNKRYRFTLAEELAHFLIHQNIYKNCRTVNERIEREGTLSNGQR